MADILDFIPVLQEDANTIRARVDADLNAGLDPADPSFQDTTPGGWWYDWSQPILLEMERGYDTMGTDMVAAMLPAFAWGDYLDEHGLTVNVERKDAAAASGSVTISGDDGTIIAVGAQVATTQTDPAADPVVFETTQAGTISGGSVTLPIVAVDAGSTGNVAAGQINVLLSGIAGVSAVSNASATTGGADVETDDQFRERVLLEWQAAHGGGTIGDYEKFALDFEGVGFVKVIPLVDGPGTVGVIITDASNKPLSQTVVDGLQNQLDPPEVTSSLSVGETLPASVVNVLDTTGFDATGRARIADQVIAYSGVKAITAKPGAPTAAVGAAGALTGTYLYKVTFVTAEGETDGGTTSSPVTVAAQQVALSNIPIGPTGVTARKVYRTAAGGADGTQKLVATIADNTTTTLNDNNADGTLGAAVPTVNTTAALTGCTGGVGTFAAGQTIYQVGKGEGDAPIGAIVIVSTPSSLSVAVAAGITFQTGYSYDGTGGTIATRSDIVSAIEDYVNSLAPGDDVILNHVKAQVFLVPGVLDVTSLTLDGGSGPVAANISVDNNHVATSGVVTLS